MNRILPLAFAVAGMAAALPAAAQSSSSSVLPYTSSGYVGINVGKPDYKVDCDSSVFSCNDPDASVHVYTGGMFNDWAGLELGYLDFGKADRLGGDTRARGINLSLVGRVPLGAFSVYGKLGTTYSRTRVSVSPLSTEPSGKDSSWGAAYGIGAGYDFTPNWSVVLEANRHEMHFVGAGRENVDTLSLGLKYRF